MANQRTTPSSQRLYSGGSDRQQASGGGMPEKVVLLHLGILIVGLSWWFGGQSPGARQALLAWGSVGIALFFIASGKLRQTGKLDINPLVHLWPLLLFDVLVVVSCFNPSTRVVLHEGEEMFLHTDAAWSWLPSSARPDLSWRELWMLNGIVISCYNAFMVLRSRSVLRQLLGLTAVNALLLAVFGTFQKLSGAKALWFGLVPSPQPFFFSTFVYHNHWGAFTTLNVAVCLGLLFHAYRRGGHRDFWHSPVLLGAVAIVFIAATAPLSASRSTTALLAFFLCGAFVHFLFQVIRRRRNRRESAVLPIAGISLAALLTVGGVVYLAQDVIQTRALHTAAQIAELRSEADLNSRLQLYRDTVRMATEKPWFGWGLESYGDVFRIFNAQRPKELWFGQRIYQDAHSDWLQSVAETGLSGTALLICLGIAPLLRVSWRQLQFNLPHYLLAGCGLVLLYAWVEFPFANPSVLVAFWTCLYIAARYARLDLRSQPAENNDRHA